MEWLVALAIVAGNTITVLVVQLFGNRRQKAETEFSIVQAQHVVLKDLYAALEKGNYIRKWRNPGERLLGWAPCNKPTQSAGFLTTLLQIVLHRLQLPTIRLKMSMKLFVEQVLRLS